MIRLFAKFFLFIITLSFLGCGYPKPSYIEVDPLISQYLPHDYAVDFLNEIIKGRNSTRPDPFITAELFDGMPYESLFFLVWIDQNEYSYSILIKDNNTGYVGEFYRHYRFSGEDEYHLFRKAVAAFSSLGVRRHSL